MNIVYKFYSTVSGKYYIGSKTECEVVEGKILDRKGMYYYSSCRDKGFWVELSEGNLLLEVLEHKVLRDDLLKREAYWQIKLNYNSDLCWNQVVATQLHPSMSKETQFYVRNRFGQTTNEIAVHNSTTARLDSQARKEGFDNHGERILHYLKDYKSMEVPSYRSMDLKYNRKGLFNRLLKDKDLGQTGQIIDILKIKKSMREGATFIKACEILGYEAWWARYCIGNLFKDIISREAIVAEFNGFLTREDFNLQVLKDFLDGKTRSSIAESYKNITISTVSRILDQEFRKRIVL